MSRRTFEANKAILAAWEREQNLVREGKGTRDWTQEQQQDILDKGKAYDDNGRAFEGQHMKSVEKYPEYQGDPNNIQFLTKAEHLEAHQGNWQNPTNWCYEPVSKQFFAFGECELIPCEIIELSNPVVTVEVSPVNTETETEIHKEALKEQSSGTDPPIDVSTDNQPSVPKPTKNSSAQKHSKGTVMDGFVNAVNAVKDFSDKHPVLTTVVEVGLGITVAVVTGKVIDTKIKSKPSGSSSHSLANTETIKAITDKAVDVISKFDFKNSESALKQLGYTVAKSIGLSDPERQKILQQAITNGVMSKDEICTYLENNINLHKNQASFEEAVSKWMSDLIFLKNI